MTKLHFVKRARKRRPKHGIKPGDSYYWWRFFGKGQPTYISKTKPPRSSYATRNPDLAAVMDAEDEFEQLSGGDPMEVAETLMELSVRVGEVGDSCLEKSESMRQRFPNGCPSMETLETRSSTLLEISRQLREGSESLNDGSSSEDVQAVLDRIIWEYE